MWLRPELRLPGYEGSGSIEITFNFSGGIQVCLLSSARVSKCYTIFPFQGPEHPNPGQPYRNNSFPRKAYLPDNKEGEMALHGVYMAWNNRLMFTVGQ